MTTGDQSAVGRLPVGSEFAGFRIDGVLGSGAMGVVYRAYDPRLDRPVALKVVAARVADDEAFRQRFLVEAKTAAKAEHPGIVAIYAAGEEQGIPYIAMRLIEGRELSEAITAGRIAPADAIAMLGPIASALDAAAEAGVVHRDVKPSNILVPSDGSGAVLVDFGIGRVRGSTRATQSGSWLGTALYVAPEQIQGGEIDGRADQYSLACVLTEMLTGQAPFVHEAIVQMLWAHVNVPPPSLQDALGPDYAALDEVLARALAKDPDQRFDTATDFLDAARVAVQSVYPGRAAVPLAVPDVGPTGTVLGGAVPPLAPPPTGMVEAGAAPDAPLQSIAPADEGRRGHRTRAAAIAALVAGLLLLGGVVLIATGGEETDPAPDRAQAASTTGSGEASGADDREEARRAADEELDDVINTAGQWRDTFNKPNDRMNARVQLCSGESGDALATCMKPVATRPIYRTIARWFEPLGPRLEVVWADGAAIDGFHEDHAACHEAAQKAISRGGARASLLGEYYEALRTGDVSTASRAQKELGSSKQGFDVVWASFISACDLPKTYLK